MGSIAPPCCSTGEITALAEHQLNAELMPKFPEPWSQRCYELIRLHQRKITQQHGEVASERNSVTQPAGVDMPALRLPVCGQLAAADVRLIHHVVMQ
jgi:hypothetical protein